jgi:hypothetical protein
MAAVAAVSFFFVILKYFCYNMDPVGLLFWGLKNVYPAKEILGIC